MEQQDFYTVGKSSINDKWSNLVVFGGDLAYYFVPPPLAVAHPLRTNSENLRVGGSSLV